MILALLAGKWGPILSLTLEKPKENRCFQPEPFKNIRKIDDFSSPGPKKCASAAGNSKLPKITKNGREMGRHKFVLTILDVEKISEAPRSSWDRSRGSNLNFFF